MRKHLDKTLVTENTRAHLSEICHRLYGLGRLSRAYINHRGYINVNYEVEILTGENRRRYFMRFYRGGVPEENIRFEHGLLNELDRRGFDYSPGIIKTVSGETYGRISETPVEDTRGDFVAMFSFVPGEDRYTWTAPDCTREELRDAARVLALYHGIIHDWRGAGCKRHRAIDQVVALAQKWRRFEHAATDSYAGNFLKETYDDVRIALDTLPLLTAKARYDTLPHVVIHGDFHPGNLKFGAGKVSGVVDFDWSRMDARSFDVALAIYYFCTSWKNDTNGFMNVDKIESFLEAYQEEAVRSGGIGPLDVQELEHLADLISLGNLFIVDWILDEIDCRRADTGAYLSYLRHCRLHIRWMRENKRALVGGGKRYQK